MEDTSREQEVRSEFEQGPKEGLNILPIRNVMEVRKTVEKTLRNYGRRGNVRRSFLHQEGLLSTAVDHTRPNGARIKYLRSIQCHSVSTMSTYE